MGNTSDEPCFLIKEKKHELCLFSLKMLALSSVITSKLKMPQSLIVFGLTLTFGRFHVKFTHTVKYSQYNIEAN